MVLPYHEQAYDALADVYDKMHLRWLRFAGGEAQCAYEGAMTALLHPGVRILDVACGTGTVLRRLIQGANGAFEPFLLDTSARMLDKCRDISGKQINSCMTDLPFSENHFDLLSCAWGLETLEDTQHALMEFTRVTKPDGHICLVFCADRPTTSLAAYALRHSITASGLGRFLDSTVMAQQAKNAGAKYVQVLHCTGPACAMLIHV